MANCLTRICVEENTFERKKREREEEEKEDREKERLKAFKMKNMRPKRTRTAADKEPEEPMRKRMKVFLKAGNPPDQDLDLSRWLEVAEKRCNRAGELKSRLEKERIDVLERMQRREDKKRKADWIDDVNQPEGWKLRQELEQTGEDLPSNLEPVQSNPVPVPTHPQILTEAFARIDDENLPEGWTLKQELKQTSEDLTSNLEPVQSNPMPGGPCHHIGVGAPLQKINTRARVLTDRARNDVKKMRQNRREKAICLTSLSAWWLRVEKEERKFWREVCKENVSRCEERKRREKKRKEKSAFIEKFFPACSNSPGGTLTLCPDRKISPSTTKRGVEKIYGIPSSNLSATFSVNKSIFEKHDIHMQESENIKESIGLISVSNSSSTISETDQSQAGTWTGGGENIESLMSNQQ